MVARLINQNDERMNKYEEHTHMNGNCPEVSLESVPFFTDCGFNYNAPNRQFTR
jgi:hypothetical protein